MKQKIEWLLDAKPLNPLQSYDEAFAAVQEYVALSEEFKSGRPTQFDEIMHAWFCGFCSISTRRMIDNPYSARLYRQLWFSGNWFQGKVAGLEAENVTLHEKLNRCAQFGFDVEMNYSKKVADLEAENAQLCQQLAEVRG